MGVNKTTENPNRTIKNFSSGDGPEAISLSFFPPESSMSIHFILLLNLRFVKSSVYDFFFSEQNLPHGRRYIDLISLCSQAH